MGENAIFWDKNIKTKELKQILKEENNPKFIEMAAFLLSRTNNPGTVFNNYLSKIRFCRYWNKIKRKMRRDKWGSNRVIFWDEVYKAVLKGIDKNELKGNRQKRTAVSEELRAIGRQIKEKRISAGWTQKQLAGEAKLSQQLVSFLENGYLNISFLTLKRVADVLELEISIQDRKATS
ncbi:MAG: helix-turn-helix transcriptional regulator [Candidatus Omnitrophota bacterium]